MAKCVRDLFGVIIRVDDEQAKKLVDNHNFEYVSKSAWKSQREANGEVMKHVQG